MMSKYKYNLSVSPGSTKKNMTGGWRIFKPVFDHKKCIGCGSCERFCPEGVCFAVSAKGEHNVSNNTPLTTLKRGYFECDLDYCKGCGICAKECPAKAIEMIREEK